MRWVPLGLLGCSHGQSSPCLSTVQISELQGKLQTTKSSSEAGTDSGLHDKESAAPLGVTTVSRGEYRFVTEEMEGLFRLVFLLVSENNTPRSEPLNLCTAFKNKIPLYSGMAPGIFLSM